MPEAPPSPRHPSCPDGKAQLQHQQNRQAEQETLWESERRGQEQLRGEATASAAATVAQLEASHAGKMQVPVHPRDPLADPSFPPPPSRS